MTWLLGQLRPHARKAEAFLDWEQFRANGRGLFLWEAFVSGAGKRTEHWRDAKAAVMAFPPNSDRLTSCLTVPRDCDTLSLAGAALLHSGWSRDLSLLRKPCVVLKSSVRRTR
jgi:hypothetical protein